MGVSLLYKIKEVTMKKIVLGALIILAFGVYDIAFAAEGEGIYKSKCQACHGQDGKGTAMAPAFVGSSFIKSSSDEQVADTILKGRQAADKHYKQYAIGMPAQKLSADEVKSVIEYLKTLAGK